MLVKREIVLGHNDATLDKCPMTLGARIEERRKAIGITQAELARRVGVRQSTMNSLIKGDSRTSRSLFQIARELRTTPDYLLGKIDDPDEGAPPPELPPTVQHLMMPVAFPSQPALEAMLRGLLRSMPDLSGDALAHELSMLLPTGLAQLRQPYRFEALGFDDAAHELEEEPATARRVQSQGSRR